MSQSRLLLLGDELVEEVEKAKGAILIGTPNLARLRRNLTLERQDQVGKTCHRLARYRGADRFEGSGIF